MSLSKFGTLGKKMIFPALVFFTFNTIFIGCKKESNSNHYHPEETLVPYLPFAVYVANEEDESITVIDPLENKITGAIQISDHSSTLMVVPHNVQVSPDGKLVWVTATSHSDGGTEQVIVIDPVQSHKIIKKIDVGTDQHLAHVVLDSSANYAFVTANKSNQVIQIDAKTFTEVKRFNLNAGHSPHGLRYSGGCLYVANMEAKSLSIINVASGQIKEINLGGIAVQTAITPDNKYVFISLYDTKQIARYDLQNETVTKIALPPGAQGPVQMYPTPDSKLLYVCDQGALNGDPVSNKVYVMNIATSEITNTIVAGYATHGVVVSNDGKKVYVTNSLSNTVSVIDVIAQETTHTFTVGKSPNGISFRFPNGGMP